MTRSPGIFISYRRIDTNWAAVALRHRLSRELPGANVFMDITGIAPGDDFREVINQQVDQCDILIAFIGSNWLTVSDNHGKRRLDHPNDFVRLEISRALEQDMTVLPVLIDDAPMPVADALPQVLTELAYRNAMQIRHNSHERDSGALCDFLVNRFPQAKDKSTDSAPQRTAPVRQDVGDAVAAALLDAGVDAKTMLSVAQMRYEAGKHREEYAILAAAHPRLVKDEGEESDWVLSNLHNMTYAQLNQGKAAEAEDALTALLTLCEKVNGAEHPNTLATRLTLAQSQLHQGKAAEAEGSFTALLPLMEKVSGTKHPNTLNTCCVAAQTLLNQGKAAEAEDALTALLPLYEKANGAEHPNTLAMRRLVAQALLEQGKAEDARALLDALPEDGGDTDPLRIGQTHLLRGFLADLLGDAAAAEGHLDKSEGALAHLLPQHYVRRELEKYRKTRVPGGSGGTTLWMLDPDS